MLDLLKGLKEKRCDVALLAGPTVIPEVDVKAFKDETGIPVKIIKQLKRDIAPFSDLIALCRIIFTIKKERPDILHTHTSKAGFLGRLAGFITHVPFVVHTPHGHIFYGYFSKWKTLFYILLEKIASVFSDRIVTLTPLERDDYIRLKIANKDKIRTIHCGINVKQYMNKSLQNFNIRDEFNIKKTSPLIGWVGRFEPVKGCFNFLEACAMLAKDFPDARFLMAGDGSMREDIELYVKNGILKGRLFLAGYRGDVVSIMKGIDVFVLSSVNEGLGMVIVEAMAAGKPVVATDVGGVSEVVIDNVTGILVPPNRPEALAQAVKNILSDKGLAREFGEAGRKRAALFDTEVMVDKTLKLYNELTDIPDNVQ